MSEVQSPTVGRVVHYFLGFSLTGEPQFRPATVVRAWPGDIGVNIVVQLDGTNDSDVRYVGDDAMIAKRAKILDGAEQATNEEQRYDVSTLLLPCEKAVTVAEAERCAAWRTSVHPGATPGTWRWPPRS